MVQPLEQISPWKEALVESARNLGVASTGLDR